MGIMSNRMGEGRRTPLARHLGIWAVLAMLLLAGCQQGELGDTSRSTGGFGGIVAHAVWPEGSAPASSSFKTFAATPIPAQVEAIRLTVTGPGISPDKVATFEIASTPDRSGVVQGVPAGTGRSLTIEALDGAANPIYSGAKGSITVVAGQTADVNDITMDLVGASSGALTIVTPVMVGLHLYSNADELTVSGACTDTPAHTVYMYLDGEDDPVASAECGDPVAGEYTLQLPDEAADGTYNYTLVQEDKFTEKATATVTWIWDLDNVEGPVTLTESAATTGSFNVDITGSCVDANTVYVKEMPSGSWEPASCSGSNAFSKNVTQLADGTYTYDVIQTDLAGNESTAQTFTWTIDSSLPATPSISIPASSASSQTALGSITATCTTSEAHTVAVTENGTTVFGPVSCSSSPITATFTGGSTEGTTYTYSVTQTRVLTGIASAAATRTWTIDTTAPSAPTISTPEVVAAGGTYTGPYISGETDIEITGACETGATVTLTGGTTSPESETCSGGTYSLTADGVSLSNYALTIAQTDAAGNASGATTFNWQPNTEVPSTPVVTGPSTNPYYGQSLGAISGTCTDGHTVDLAGPASLSLSQTCGATVTGTYGFTFTGPGVDGPYTYTLTQTNTTTSITSAGVTLTFNRDNAVAVPVITTPATSTVTNGLSSITIEGTCEANGTVHVANAATADYTCTSGGSFSFTDNQSDDDSYVYSITQTDLAGNTSTAATVTWNRETAPAAPAITLPLAEPYYSNAALTTLSGTCIAGLRVDLDGDDSGTTTCTGGGTFSFSLAGQAANDTYYYDVTQTNTGSGLTSSAVTRTWVYDTSAPATVGLTESVITSNNGTASIAGTCETGTTVYLVDVTGSGAGNQSQTCTGGVFSFTVGQSTTGTFTYEVHQTDAAGNSSGAATQQWNRPAPGYTVTPTSGLAVSESGTWAEFTVVLQSTPNGTVRVNVATGDATEGSVNVSYLEFNAGNAGTPQTVRVTGIDDSTVDGNQTFQISLTTDTVLTTDTTGYDGINPANVSVTAIDIGAPGVTVTPTSGLVVCEYDSTPPPCATAQFTVVLNKAPDGDVVINVASQDTSEITVSASTLTFTTSNWSVAQTITLSSVDDLIADGNQAVTIQVSMNTGSTADTTGYAAINPADVTATGSDNDSAGFTVTPTTGLVTTEGGGKATFTVAMNTSPNPGEVVVVNVASQDTTEVSSDKASLTFTSLDWYQPQTVTLTGVDDAVQDGNQSTTIAMAVNTGLTTDTTGYASINPSDPAVINTDNDVVGVTVTPTTLTTSENGSEAEFNVRLNTQPTGTVVILVNNGDFSEISVDKTTLTFTASDWQTPQYVRVTGVSDALADGNILVNIQLIVDTTLTTDNLYDPLDPADVSVTNLDNTDAVTVTPTSGLQTTDAGGTDSFTVVLNTQPDPGTVVVVNVASGNTDEVTVSSGTLTFDEFSWNTPQTVTLTGVDIGSGGSQIVTIQLTVNAASTTFDAYDALNPADVTVTNLHLGTPGFTVSKSSVTTSESGGSESFTVSIATAPSTDVVFDIVSNDPGEVTTDKATLTFNSSNWTNPQTVTAKGVNDTETDGNIATSITVSVDAAASDNDYDALSAQTVNVTNTDNEPAAQGTAGSPLSLNGLIPYDATVPSSTAGSSYYVITGLIPTTQSYYISISSLVNPALLEVFQVSDFSGTAACTGNQNPTSSRPKSCSTFANASGVLYIKVTSNSSSAGATFKLDVVTAPVNEGATGAGNQINLTYASLPYDLGQVGTGTSYYKITGVPASVNKLVRVTNMTANVNLRVYSADTFNYGTVGLCAPSDSGIAEACIAAVPGSGELFVSVAWNDTGSSATFELDIVDPPVNQGASGNPLDITGQLPYAGTMLGPDPTDSYYVISGLTPGTTYTVALTEVTNGIELRVYSDINFSTQLCNSSSQPGNHGLNAPESCPAAANSSGRLYVQADAAALSSGAGTTFNIRIQ